MIDQAEADSECCRLSNADSSKREEERDKKPLAYTIDETGLLSIPEDSPLHPWNRSSIQKTNNLVINACCALFAMDAATSTNGASTEISEVFNVSGEVVMLNGTAYLLGITIGAALLSIVSETYGRRRPLCVSLFFCGLLTMMTGNMDGIAPLVIYHFVAGIFAGGPLSITTGSMTDILRPENRIFMSLIYGSCTTLGAAMGPTFQNLISTHISSASQAMRWAEWLPGIGEMALGIYSLFYLEETYPLIVEKEFVNALRKATGNQNLSSRIQRKGAPTLKKSILRPIEMFFQPCLICYNGLSGFSYGVFFIMISTIPDVFAGVYGFGRTVSQLPIYGFVAGVFLGLFSMVTFDRTRVKRVARKLGKYPPPEVYLEIMMAGALALSAGCFVYGWTLFPSIHWLVPTIGLGICGFGFAIIYNLAILYMVQFYTTSRASYSATVIATNLMTRNPMAAGFPLFSRQMYWTLGNHWASSLIGFILLLGFPVTVIFYIYGDRIRRNDRFRKQLDSI